MNRLYELVNELPPEIQQKAIDILEFLLEKRGMQSASSLKSNAKEIPISSNLKQEVKSKFFEKARRIAMARADLVRLYCQAMARAPQGLKCLIQKEFLAAYHEGKYPELYAKLGPTSRATIWRWKQKLEQTGNPLALSPRWGEHQRGHTKISEEQAKCLRAAGLKHQTMAKAIRQAKKIMRDRGVPDNLHEATYLRFLKRFRESHF
jgi:hypothetical protein